MEIKHFVSGSPIRLENCVKGRGEVGWSHGQVRGLRCTFTLTKNKRRGAGVEEGDGLMSVTVKMRSLQVLTFGWREDIRVGDPMHTRKVCFDAVSHNSPVTLYDCHGMKGNQLWRYRKVRQRKVDCGNLGICYVSSPQPVNSVALVFSLVS